jgi:hypothetical protein
MDLYSHYKLNFDVTQYHKFTLTEINEMIPFEREVYVDMILEKIQKEKSNNGPNIWDS